MACYDAYKSLITTPRITAKSSTFLPNSLTHFAVSNTETSPNKNPDLEVKDALFIFNSVWDGLQAERGKENMRFPKEIILLGGAPGSGKTTLIGKWVSLLHYSPLADPTLVLLET